MKVDNWNVKEEGWKGKGARGRGRERRRRRVRLRERKRRKRRGRRRKGGWLVEMQCLISFFYRYESTDSVMKFSLASR